MLFPVSAVLEERGSGDSNPYQNAILVDVQQFTAFRVKSKGEIAGIVGNTVGLRICETSRVLLKCRRFPVKIRLGAHRQSECVLFCALLS
jgi:hypothetical protein